MRRDGILWIVPEKWLGRETIVLLAKAAATGTMRQAGMLSAGWPSPYAEGDVIIADGRFA
jgi:hypothetical protein